MTHRNYSLTEENKAEITHRLKKIIQELNQEADAGTLLVVEGKKDTRALRALGFKGDCFEISQGGFPQFLQEAETRRHVILLLDYDRKGRYIFARALRVLHSKGIPADSKFRLALRIATGGQVRHIEEIVNYAD